MSERFQALSAGLLADGYAIRFRVRGLSMLPLIADGEAIIVEPILTQSIRRGDILLYSSVRGGVIAHRVVRVERAGLGRPVRLTLRGDASISADEPIAATEVLGRVRAVERDGRIMKIHGRRARLRWRISLCAEQLRILRAVGMAAIGGRGD
jgi:signal peptidase I